MYICIWNRNDYICGKAIDVQPFVQAPRELDIWSNDYFEQLAGMIHYM